MHGSGQRKAAWYHGTAPRRGTLKTIKDEHRMGTVLAGGVKEGKRGAANDELYPIKESGKKKRGSKKTGRWGRRGGGEWKLFQ